MDTYETPQVFNIIPYICVQVLTEVVDLNLTCPAAVERNVQFECKVELKQGSDVSIQIDFDDGTTAGGTPPIYLAGWFLTSMFKSLQATHLYTVL